MFRWAANVSSRLASSVSDSLGPLFRSPLDDLKSSWSSVEAECARLMALDETGAASMEDVNVIKQSSLLTHLNHMVEALVKEEEQQAQLAEAAAKDPTGGAQSDAAADGSITASGTKSTTGPCFEYFLNEKILDRLCAMGLADRPIGMRQLVTRTLDATLLHTRHPLLPSMSVHLALRQFIEVCWMKEDHKRRGYRSALLSLLHTIAKKIREDNGLAAFFFDVYPKKEKRKPEFLIFTILSSLASESSDGALAYEALLWLAQLPNPGICDYILAETNYIQSCVESLANLFRAFPPPTECPLLDELVATSSSSSSPSSPSSSSETQQGFPALEQLFKRWQYIDDLASSCYARMGRVLSEELRKTFFLDLLQPMILDPRENVAIWTTNAIKHLTARAKSNVVRRIIIHFLLGNETIPELPPSSHSTTTTVAAASHSDSTAPSTPSPSSPSSPSSSSSSSPPMRTILLKRLDSLNDTLCIHTLSLFHTLITLRDPMVMHNLILRNLVVPIQHASNATDTTAASLPPATPSTAMLSSADPDRTRSVLTPTPIDILPIPQHIMFEGFKGLTDFASLPNFEDYLLDAQFEGQLWMRAWDEELQLEAERRAQRIEQEAKEEADRNIQEATGSEATSLAQGNGTDDHTAAGSSTAPSTPKKPPSSSPATTATPTTNPASSHSPSQHPFYEGLFLSTLFNKLDSLYENSFATNLKLTAVLSTLAYCPHPVLHQFMFNPRVKIRKSIDDEEEDGETELKVQGDMEQEDESSSSSSSTAGSAPSTPATPAPSSSSSSSSSTASDSPRLLLHILRDLWNSGQRRAGRMANFQRRKEEARMRLNRFLGNESAGPQQTSLNVETLEGERFFRGLILLEEFLKEYSAIAHTKARLFALQKLARLQGVGTGATNGEASASASPPAQTTPTPKQKSPTDKMTSSDGGKPSSTTTTNDISLMTLSPAPPSVDTDIPSGAAVSTDDELP